MDWYSWLSQSSLDPALLYDYALLFSHNELEEDDIRHFDHHFLQSMGVSIAKHRLEILKLAKSAKNSSRPVARLLAAFGRTRKSLTKYVRNLVDAGRHDRRSAIVLVPKPPPASIGSGGGDWRWKGHMLKRSNKARVLFVKKQGSYNPPLMITEDGRISQSTSPIVFRKGSDDGTEDVSCGTVEEEKMRWDSMFQDLKPT